MAFRGNPLRYTDPSGHLIESLWDAANVAMGVGSLVENVRGGNWRAAALDAGGLVLDVAATAIPVIPGGAATAIRLGRAANQIADGVSFVNKVDNVVDTVKFADNAGDAAGLGKLDSLQAGDAGRFGGLESRAVTGDDLTPHHMPQAAAKWTTREDGGALMLPTAEHELTRTFKSKGRRTLVEDAGLSFREVLAKDIQDVRNIAGRKYNEGIRQLLEYYRQNFPELMAK